MVVMICFQHLVISVEVFSMFQMLITCKLKGIFLALYFTVYLRCQPVVNVILTAGRVTVVNILYPTYLQPFFCINSRMSQKKSSCQNMCPSINIGLTSFAARSSRPTISNSNHRYDLT